MEFRKMITTTLYARQQKRHSYKEQTFGYNMNRQKEKKKKTFQRMSMTSRKESQGCFTLI